MNLRIIECEQGSDAWHTARAGIPTASEFATVLASGRGGGESVTRRKYMLTLLGERLTGKVADGYSNGHMERGHQMEPDARRFYAFSRDVEPQQVGFMVRDDVGAGASPDSLVGDRGLLEIKTKLPHLQLDVLLRDEVPSEHSLQLQGQLFISGREFVDFVSYWPGLPLFVKRVYREEPLIARIRIALDEFNAELASLQERIGRIAA